MDLDRLEQILAEHGEPKYRARQVWAWAARGVSGYEAMTDLPATLRERLAQELPFSTVALRSQRESSDGTVKALFETTDGRPVEAVLMRYRDRADGRAGRRSVCLSSQSGCPLTCTFCATGQMKFGRNLTGAEILDQALYFRRIEGIDHCVFMGMGEPLMNLDAVLGACERLPEVGVTHRRTTISTVGWIPGIERLARETDMPVRLALSLHAAEEALRSELMPVNERYPLHDVLEACRAFYERRRRRVFVEYVMLAGVNDRYEQALQLAKALTSGTASSPTAGTRAESQCMFKVNLIPYNPSGTGLEGSSRTTIAAFKAALESRGVPATVRLTRGRDIDAACGQLAARAADLAAA